jgi:DNA (cytosine-5)-methyltransferase 1
VKLGSLFDGIGTFPLSASQYGIKPVWASEIEPFPIKVTQHHFPDMKHLGDITKVNGAEIEPVDVITFGSPCQDLSVAGKRAGLEGERSGLFSEAIRIIKEMRCATDDKYPRYAIWENVPGAFSSNRGLDFKAVLEEITESKIPMPQSGKWATAGMVRGDGYSVAWRVLDAQYFGVPQRRRRIFLIADFAGQRAPEILFESEGLCRDFTESRKAREEVATGAGDSTPNASYWDEGQISDTLDCSMLSKQQAMPEKRRFAAVLTPQLYDMTHADEVIRPVEPGLCPTLNARMGTGGNQIPIYCLQVNMIGRADKNGPQGSGVNEDVSFTLNATDHHGVAYAVRTANTNANGHGVAEEKAHTLDGAQGQVVCSIDCRNLYENEELSGTLQCKQTGGYSLNYQNPVRVGYAVRRLTPLECERLMGLPDNWTNIEGASDTARYKAIGNGIAKPCSDFVIGRIAEICRRV